MLGWLLSDPRFGLDQDCKQALEWLEKGAAQDDAPAHRTLGEVSQYGQHGQTPSMRRARERYQRAVSLGDEHAKELLKTLEGQIQNVMPLSARPSAAPRTKLAPPNPTRTQSFVDRHAKPMVGTQ